jgi:hypothetical protein
LNEPNAPVGKPSLPWHFATALGLWWMAVTLAYLAATRVGCGCTFSDVFIELAQHRWQAPPIAVTLGLPVAVGFGFFAVVMILGAIGAVLRVDVARHSAEALAWAVNAPARRYWIILFLLAFVPVAMIVADIDWGYVLILLPLLSLMLLPLFAGERAALAGPATAWRPSWHWPGIAVIGFLIALQACMFALDLALARFYGVLVDGWTGQIARVVPELATSVIGLWVTAASVGALVDVPRSGASFRTVMRNASRWQVVSAFAAIGVRAIGWASFVVPLVLLVMLHGIYIAPQLQDYAKWTDYHHLELRWLYVVAEQGTFWLAVLIVPWFVLANFRLWVRLHPTPPAGAAVPG